MGSLIGFSDPLPCRSSTIPRPQICTGQVCYRTSWDRPCASRFVYTLHLWTGWEFFFVHFWHIWSIPDRQSVHSPVEPGAVPSRLQGGHRIHGFENKTCSLFVRFSGFFCKLLQLADMMSVFASCKTVFLQSV